MKLKIKLLPILITATALAQTKLPLNKLVPPVYQPPAPHTVQLPPPPPPPPPPPQIKVPEVKVGPGTVAPTVNPAGVKYTVPWNPK